MRPVLLFGCTGNGLIDDRNSKLIEDSLADRSGAVQKWEQVVRVAGLNIVNSLNVNI